MQRMQAADSFMQILSRTKGKTFLEKQKQNQEKPEHEQDIRY